MAEYIEREKDKYIKLSQALEVLDSCACWWAHERMERIPAADVVPTELYNQILWERDTALAQLAEIGKGLGEKMDDVRPVVRGRWITRPYLMGNTQYCSRCGENYGAKYNFCPNCGADMREES